MYLFTIDWNSFNLNFNINIIFLIIIIILIVFFAHYNNILEKILNLFNKNSEVIIDELNLGIGSNSIKIKPNNKDKEIVYKLWVELSTRKIGIPLDWDNDVIYEIYDSWYVFFGIARDLLKEFPVSKLQNESSTEIISITNKILNTGLRSHLTKWQAKYRRWYEKELENYEHTISPQKIQQKYPQYDELIEDMGEVNKYLINYKKILYKIAFDEEEDERKI